MYVAGLTGSIATGKTTVSLMFAELGASIVDADRIAREVVAPGMPAWQKIVETFGKGVVLPSGELDRHLIGSIVFSDSELRARLEAIVHPEVKSMMAEQISRIEKIRPGSVVILDVPLLIETGMHRGLDDVVVVYCPPDVQLRRLMERDGLEREQAMQRIGAQMPIEEKRRLASMVIDNSGSIEETRRQVCEIYAAMEAKACVSL